MDVSTWSCEDVSNWLQENEFSDYTDKMFHHKIDGSALLSLSEKDLREAPLALTILGDIKRMSAAIRKLQQDFDISSDPITANGDIPAPPQGATINRTVSMCSETSYDDDDLVVYPPSPQRLRPLRPEYTKLGLAFGYMGCVLLLTAYVMVVVNDRVPDMRKYPPLPDLMLDNIPYIEWAFELCEVTALLLNFILFVVLVFHKHRLV